MSLTTAIQFWDGYDKLDVYFSLRHKHSLGGALGYHGAYASRQKFFSCLLVALARRRR